MAMALREAAHRMIDYLPEDKIAYVISILKGIEGINISEEEPDQLDLLWQLFDEVIIPKEVYNEIVVSEERLGAKELKKAIEDGNIRIHNVKNQKLVSELHGRLHNR